jgi:hypothetical protein
VSAYGGNRSIYVNLFDRGRNISFRLDTLVQGYSLPMIRAAVALQRDDPSRTIELLRTASDIELYD